MIKNNLDEIDSTYPKVWQSSWLLFVLFIAYTLSFIDRQILTLLVGPIQQDIGLSDFEISLLHGFAFAIFFFLADLAYEPYLQLNFLKHPTPVQS